MDSIVVHLFKQSHEPFIALLDEHGIPYQTRLPRPGVIMASGAAIEIIQTIGSAAIWPSIATVVVAFINSRRARKVIITTKENTVIHAEGLSHEELTAVLKQARSLAVIDPNNEGQ